jgi:D-glycero-D-manno-heptose 1,7-bisphosphate phosphatase
MKRWAVFLDRDGVINEEVNYLSSPELLKLLPGAAHAIRLLNRRRIPVIVVSNQAGVARGRFPEEQVQTIHDRLSALLSREGAHIDRYYYCPHHPTEGTGSYRIDCECRKPKPGLLLKAGSEMKLDLQQSYIVGDKVTDVEAGMRAGVTSILVLTGYGESLWRGWPAPFQPHYVARDLGEAVSWILDSVETVNLARDSHGRRS